MAGHSHSPGPHGTSHGIRDGEVITLRVQVARCEVLRQLGYRDRKSPRESVDARIDALWDHAAGMIRPRGALRRICKRDARSAGAPCPEGGGWAAVVTIGAALEDEAARLQDSGDLLGALILDSFGSAAAEAAAEALEALVVEGARTLGLATRRRVSPGYGTWDVARQADLLALLPMEALGMRLTDGMMMIPRKSVSFFAGAAGEASSWEAEAGCPECGSSDTCRYRREG